MSPLLFRHLNALVLLGITGILSYAFADQLLFRDLPCPLCLLQRVGFVVAGFGFALNVLQGPRTAYYGIAIFGSLAGAAVSARQMFLHIAPGSGSYGEALLGMHFYTLALIAFIGLIMCATILMMFERQYQPAGSMISRRGWQHAPGLGKLAVLLFTLIIAANAGSTFLECGTGMCADDPTGYQLLQ